MKPINSHHEQNTLHLYVTIMTVINCCEIYVKSIPNRIMTYCLIQDRVKINIAGITSFISKTRPQCLENKLHYVAHFVSYDETSLVVQYKWPLKERTIQCT